MNNDIDLHISKKIKIVEHIEKQVNRTILGNCLYFNKRNLDTYSKGKYMEEQYKNYLLLQTLDEESRESLRKFEDKSLKVRIRIWSDASMKELLIDKKCAVNRANRAFTVSWDNSIKVILQGLFPVSTALAICGKKDIDISKASPFYESIGIKSFVENNGGWDIYPVQQVSTEGVSDEYKLIIPVLRDYSRNLYLNTSKVHKSKREHPNAFRRSTPWRNANEFEGMDTAAQNCIYTLASEPDEKGICRVYVGEAVTSGNRLKAFKFPEGKVYIDHTRKEAEERKFTRYRMDILKEEATEFLHDAQDTIIGVLRMLEEECPKGYIM